MSFNAKYDKLKLVNIFNTIYKYFCYYHVKLKLKKALIFKGIINMKKKPHFLKNIYGKCPFRWSVFFIYYLLQAIMPYLYGFIISILLNMIVTKSFWENNIILSIVIVTLVFGINTTIYKWGPLLYDYVTFKLRKKFQKDFFTKLSKLDVLYFQKQQNLEKKGYAENAIGYDFFNYGSATLLFFISLFTLIAASISLLSYSFFVLILTIAISIGSHFFKKHIRNKERTFDDSLKKYELQLNYYKRIYENKNVLFESKIYNLFDEFSKKIIDLESLIKIKTNLFVKKQTILWIFYFFIKYSFNIFIFLLIIDVVKNSSSPSIGALYFGIQLFTEFINDFDDRLNDIISLKISKKYINDYYDIINMPENFKNNLLISNNQDSLISTKNLNFIYDKSSSFSLTNIDLDIIKNKTIAILGENGSGKSTLINILLKTYYNDLCVYSENIFINHNIGAIFQDYHKYSFTLRENISLGDLSKNYTDEEILDTFNYIESTSILNKISLDDYLGDSYNLGGKNISEGEWQKLNLCKVFLKKDRELYVFDEPTSSLDPKMEYNLYNNIKRYTKNKTTILISHRIGFAKLADYIYVLDAGKIIEKGTHNELIKKKGKYASLYNEQIKYYDESLLKGES